VRRALAATALLFGLAGCTDPTLEAQADALGPEPGPYEEGPLHRAGQPCTVCHAKGGRGEPRFDLAGTVYELPESKEGLPGVTVRLFDGQGRQQSLTTNSVGSFFLEEGELELEFPLWVRLEHGETTVTMTTPIWRERSCATCHRNPASPNRRWQVYLREDEP
jgi:hypothetical protein